MFGSYRYLAGLMAPTIVASLLSAATAWADTKSCIAAHSAAQRATKTAQFRTATQQYMACAADEECPERIRAECAELLDKVRAIQPSVIFSVLDGDGVDISQVRVSVGDEPLTERLDGRALVMDPGNYHVKFELPDGQVLETDVTVREGEKNRLVQMRLEKPPELAKPAALPAAEPPAPKPVTRWEKRAVPLGTWVLGGVALAGAGTFATFAVLSRSTRKELDQCAPACAPGREADFDKVKRYYLIADVGLGVGAASAAVALGLLLTRGDVETSAGVRLNVAVLPTGGAFVLSRSLQ